MTRNVLLWGLQVLLAALFPLAIGLIAASIAVGRWPAIAGKSAMA